MADYYGLLLATGGESRSVSDGESDSERRLRRSRRKRGGQCRFRPYSPDGSDEEESTSLKKSAKQTKPGKQDRFGMAPPNSTQFLLADREARADAEYENELKFEAAERRRIRSMSGSYDHLRPASFWCSIEPATTTGGSEDNESTSGESEAADREMEREFETDYLEVKRERIQSMTRSQLAAELLERDQDTQLLARELGSKETENRHLRQLLTAHGISPDEPVTSTTKSPVIAN